MKKTLLFILVIAFLLPAGAFAMALGDVVLAGTMPKIKVSQGVSGVYFNNGNANPTAYQVSTGHKQGTKVYASGSKESKLYTINNTGTAGAYKSSDLLSAYDADLASDGTWHEM